MRIDTTLVSALAATQSTITVSNDVITDSLIAAVNGVHHSCRVNTDWINAYTGGSLPTMQIAGKPVLLTFGSIHGAQTKILLDSKMTPSLSEANTARALPIVLDTLQYSVPATVEALMKKKDEFADAGLIQAVQNSLDLLLWNHEEAGKAIGPKTDKTNSTLNELMEKEVKDVTGKIIEGVEFFKAAAAASVAASTEKRPYSLESAMIWF